MDYKKKSPILNRYFNNNIYEHKKTEFPSIGESTHKRDFINHGIVVTDSCKKESLIPDALFMGKSSYQTNYLDWRNGKLLNMKPPLKTIVSMPFVGESTYKNTYVTMDLNCKNRPYPELKVHDNARFDTVSSSKDHYRGLKTELGVNMPHMEDAVNSFNFPGQFITEAQRKYTGKAQYSPTISAKRKDNFPF